MLASGFAHDRKASLCGGLAGWAVGSNDAGFQQLGLAFVLTMSLSTA